MKLPKYPRIVIGFFTVSILLAGCATPRQPDQSKAVAPAPEFKLAEAFKRPVGPKGLEPSETLLGLSGKTVRVTAHMVKEEEPMSGLFMLTPTPTSLAELADGPADYLPPATLFVHLPQGQADQVLAYLPGAWTVTGILQIGGQEEKNGRLSYVRLMVGDLSMIQAPNGQPPTWVPENATGHAHHH